MEKEGKTQNTATAHFSEREVQYLKNGPCDHPNSLTVRGKRSPNTDNVNNDRNENAPNSRKYASMSSSSKTKTVTVYKKKQKISTLDKHYDDVNDEPDTTSVADETRELNRPNSKNSIENKNSGLGGNPIYQDRITSSCSVDIATDLADKDMDNNDNESPHHKTDKAGSEKIQNYCYDDEKLQEKKSEEIKNLENINKQLEDRLVIISYNVRKLLSIPLLVKYYDSALNNVEKEIENVIRKINASKEETTLSSGDVDILREIDDMITEIDDFVDAKKMADFKSQQHNHNDDGKSGKNVAFG